MSTAMTPTCPRAAVPVVLLSLALAVAAAPWPAWLRLLASIGVLLPAVLALWRVTPPPGLDDNGRLRFLVNLVHELRTPLALVDGPLQQLGRLTHLDAEARTQVGIARQNCLRLMHLAEDLLQLARADAGAAPAPQASAAAPLALDDWLRELTAAVARHPALGPRLIVEAFDAENAFVVADARALERVYLNLVSNAIKFGAGGREIRIGSRATANEVGFFVADDGIGIDPADHARIFERFRQIDGSPTRRFGGTGIGLALVRDLALAMRGRIEVASTLGAGACFTVWLPRCTAPVRFLPPPRRHGGDGVDQPEAFEWTLRRPLEPTARDAAANESAPPRPRILVVEDEPELRWLLESALRASFDVVTAADGEAGLATATRLRPDIVLTDWMMPGLDGLALAQRLRALDPAPKIVLITAKMDEDERADALRAGVDDFLAKPFSLAELGARLHSLARRATSEHALRATHDRLAATNRELASTRAALIQDEKLKSIGILTAGLIHEINNPVNFMRTAAELLRRAPPVRNDLETAELVDAIEQGLVRVGTIIGDLRVFAFRDDPGATARRRQRFTLAHAVGAALRLCRTQLGGVRVETALAPLEVIGAESQIVQVMVNLLVNATTALRERGREDAAPAIEVCAETWQSPRSTSSPPAPPRARIRIRDNGPGIAAEIQDRLFEPFFTTREPGQGLGLGLAVSDAIVRSHGGRLRLSSAPGAGAEFSFDLELAA
jgi:signal transduction histidine kinase